MTLTPRAVRKVLVCDDDPVRAASWVSQLDDLLAGAEGDFETAYLSAGDLGEAVGALHARIKRTKAGRALDRSDAAKPLDQADILIIDSDLTPDASVKIDPDSEQVIDDNLVGEYGSNVARLARAYSTAGVLVVVNHIYKQRTFDLTMTRFADLPADAYIAATDLDNAALWRGTPAGGFRPWAWPNLSVLRQPDATMLPGASLDSTVLVSIGLGSTDADLVDDKQWERLSFDLGNPADVTLRHVAMSPSFGIGPIADATTQDDQLLRVGKSAVRRWLEHVVLPSQNVFVDLPHLLQDRPWLAGGARKDAEALSALLAGSWEVHQGIVPEAFSSAATALIGRAVWRVDRLPSTGPGERLDAEDLVFCEDTSDFRSPAEAHEFESDILGPFRSRFVAKVDGVEYTPLRRLFV